MFESSLVESRGLVVSGTQRWTALGSVALQFAVAAALVAIPLLHPEALPMLTDAPKLFVPPAPRPPVPPVRVPVVASTSSAISIPSTVATVAASLVRSMLPGSDTGPAPLVDTGISLFGSGTGGLRVWQSRIQAAARGFRWLR